jgi:eukaryotic-like serine/threonine-protein kinase
MTRDQWVRVKRLFLEATEMSPESRHEWLARVAADDAEVLQDVESLVRAHDGAGTFVDDVLVRDLADRVDISVNEPVDPTPRDALQPGLRIGEFEILREMRPGGMSAVYLAQDVNLGRLAVLKTVPSIRANCESEAAAVGDNRGSEGWPMLSPNQR